MIIDIEMGNFGSVLNMCRKIGLKAKISNNIKDIENAEKLILPGVGHFDNAMKKIEKLHLKKILTEMVIEKNTPILGICLGMHLFFKRSDEGKLPGLGWIDGEIVKFDVSGNFKLPHMGWNFVKPIPECLLFENIINPRFYFVHNYHAICNNLDDVMCTTKYGYYFTSGIKNKNIIGVQFHPEKSHKYGKQFLKNYSDFR